MPGGTYRIPEPEEVLSKSEQNKLLELLDQDNLIFQNNSVIISNKFQITPRQSPMYLEPSLHILDLNEYTENLFFVSKETHDQFQETINKQNRKETRKKFQTFKERLFSLLD